MFSWVILVAWIKWQSVTHTHSHTHTQFLPMQVSDQLCFAPQNLKNSYLKKYVTIGIPFAESDISWLPT